MAGTKTPAKPTPAQKTAARAVAKMHKAAAALLALLDKQHERLVAGTPKVMEAYQQRHTAYLEAAVAAVDAVGAAAPPTA